MFVLDKSDYRLQRVLQASCWRLIKHQSRSFLTMKSPTGWPLVLPMWCWTLNGLEATRHQQIQQQSECETLLITIATYSALREDRGKRPSSGRGVGRLFGQESARRPPTCVHNNYHHRNLVYDLTPNYADFSQKGKDIFSLWNEWWEVQHRLTFCRNVLLTTDALARSHTFTVRPV